jgi:hypothetical protein
VHPTSDAPLSGHEPKLGWQAQRRCIPSGGINPTRRAHCLSKVKIGRILHCRKDLWAGDRIDV